MTVAVAVSVSASAAMRVTVLGEEKETKKVDDKAQDADDEDHLREGRF